MLYRHDVFDTALLVLPSACPGGSAFCLLPFAFCLLPSALM
jgi:hypothetical protein